MDWPSPGEARMEPDTAPASVSMLALTLGDAASDTDLTRATLYLSDVMRTLRKYGFYVTQDPDAQTQPDARQEIRANDAACMLLGLPPTLANVAREPVQELARALLENASVAAQRLKGRVA